MHDRIAWWAWPTEYQDEGMFPVDAADAEEALAAAREALSADAQEGEPMDVSVRRVTADDVHELQQRVEDLQRAAGGADTAKFLADQAAKIRALEARAEAAEQERDELSANGAAIVGALEERDMARAERDAARARIRDLEAALRETHDALERLDAIYASEHDPDPVLGTVLRPAWLADALHHARALLTPTPAQPRCQCQWEAGDSPCRVHGEEEGTAPEGGERVTMTIDVDALNAAPAVQCIRCNAPCSECATPTQKGAAK